MKDFTRTDVFSSGCLVGEFECSDDIAPPLPPPDRARWAPDELSTIVPDSEPDGPPE